MIKMTYEYFEVKDGWEEGDKVICTHSNANFTDMYKVGKVYTLKYESGGYLFLEEVSYNGYDGEFKKVEMEYENEWILNQGQEIPEDADKLWNLEKTSVVAYRLPKVKWEFGDWLLPKGVKCKSALVMFLRDSLLYPEKYYGFKMSYNDTEFFVKDEFYLYKKGNIKIPNV